MRAPLAADIEAGAGRLRPQDGATDSVHHATPSQAGECDGPYKVQLDAAPQTFMVAKGAGESLIVDLERRDGRAVITGVR